VKPVSRPLVVALIVSGFIVVVNAIIEYLARPESSGFRAVRLPAVFILLAWFTVQGYRWARWLLIGWFLMGIVASLSMLIVADSSVSTPCAAAAFALIVVLGWCTANSPSRQFRRLLRTFKNRKQVARNGSMHGSCRYGGCHLLIALWPSRSSSSSANALALHAT
jgi:hypothetical protein